MKKFDRGTVQARAQEIIHASNAPITVREACKQALYELYNGNHDALLDAAATLAAGAMSGLRQRTYQLPEQPTLTPAIPAVICVMTPDGDLFVRREDATADQSRQWAKEMLQYHSTGRLRAKRLLKDFDLAEDVPGEVKWPEFSAVIGERKLKILEQGA